MLLRRVQWWAAHDYHRHGARLSGREGLAVEVMVVDHLLRRLRLLGVVAARTAAAAGTAAARLGTVCEAAGEAQTALAGGTSNAAVAGEEATDQIRNTAHR